MQEKNQKKKATRGYKSASSKGATKNNAKKPVKNTKATTSKKAVKSTKRPTNKASAKKVQRRTQPKLKIFALGGLNEIGKNMTVLECGNDIIIVDCGIGFPDDDMLGVDLVIPDFTYVANNIDKVRGVFYSRTRGPYWLLAIFSTHL